MLILIRGLPGAGKTTLAKKLAKILNAEHHEADDYFLRAGKYMYDPREIMAAHAFCQYKTFKALESGKNVIVSNTFTTVPEMMPYVRFAQQHGKPFTVLTAIGKYQNVHGIPEKTIEVMKSKWETWDPSGEKGFFRYPL